MKQPLQTDALTGWQRCRRYNQAHNKRGSCNTSVIAYNLLCLDNCTTTTAAAA